MQKSPSKTAPTDILSAWTLSRDEMTEHEVLFALYDQMIGGIYRADVLRKITDVVRGAMNAERATIYVVIKETQELESLAASGLTDSLIRIPIRDRSLAGYCALTGKAFAIGDAYGDLSRVDPRLVFDRTWDKRHDFRTRDVVCVPVTFQGEVLGVIQAINSRGEAFSENDVPLLLTISRMVGHALHYALVYEELDGLKRLKKEKAEFMRIMTHELKAPLAGARMLADSLLYTQELEGKAQELVERLGKRLDNMLAMIEDILGFSQVNSGNPLGQIARIDLGPLCDEIASHFHDQAEGKGIRLVVEPPPEPIAVRLDRKGFHLILSNLISNGVKYTERGGVTVRARIENGWACLSVTDTGMGIPEADQTKVFQEFFRASNARRSQICGTGVGLAGVKGLVERFGGELDLTSREGHGTTVTVRLPRAAAE